MVIDDLAMQGPITLPGTNIGLCPGLEWNVWKYGIYCRLRGGEACMRDFDHGVEVPLITTVMGLK